VDSKAERKKKVKREKRGKMISFWGNEIKQVLKQFQIPQCPHDFFLPLTVSNPTLLWKCDRVGHPPHW
jgi:hypothetical protein